MNQDEKQASQLMSKALKLELGKKGHSEAPKPGYLPCVGGLYRWRSPELHAEIIDLYGQAFALDKAQGYPIYRRALQQLYAGKLDEVEKDWKLLVEMKSSYAGPHLPLWLYVRRKDKKSAQPYLDEINAENKRKGLPRQSLKDFEPI